MSRIIFVTGTDTGVGKTLLTASLLFHLRQSGSDALAMKPFCSGGRADVQLLQAIQGRDAPTREVNPFYFAAPIAPWIAARKKRRHIALREVLRAIARMRDRCDCLIVEAAGGLLAPLGNGFSAAEIIKNLPGCDVVIVAPNKLGTINHTLLTMAALERLRTKRSVVVLMDQRAPDRSAASNRAFLGETLAPIQVLSIPFLGKNASDLRGMEKNVKKIKKTLAHLADPDTFTARCSGRSRKATKRTV